jgi:hypothetical protein
MSEQKANSTTEKGSFRKRRPQPNRRPPQKNATEPKAAPATQEAEPVTRVPKERAPSYKWPAESLGKSFTGTVFSIIRRGKFNFGFISLSTASDYIDEKYPRVYFNPSLVGTEQLYLRRGYQVQFEAKNDQEGRSIASNITLTEEGTKTKADREAYLAQKKAERAAAPAPARTNEADNNNDETAKQSNPRKRPVRKQRGPRPEGRKVSLQVSCEGSTETKTVEADLGLPISSLRNRSCALFSVPTTHGVYFNNEFLSKTSYQNLQDGNKIHLAAKKEA